MLFRKFFTVLFATGAVAGVSADVVVTGNPHNLNHQCPRDQASSGTTGPCLSTAHLTPENIHLHLRPVQADTIVNIEPTKLRSGYGTFRAPIYHFVQSPRLVEAQLPFKLLLLKDVSAGVHTVPVDVSAGLDSWFPGYRWDLLLCDGGDGGVGHLGWKFTSPTGDAFYAVIVEKLEEDEGGVSVAQKQKENVREPLHIHPSLAALQIAPRKADAWMVSALGVFLGGAGRAIGK